MTDFLSGIRVINYPVHCIVCKYSNAALNCNLLPYPCYRTSTWRQSFIKSHELALWYESLKRLENETLRNYLLLLVFTGLRRQEGAQLTWNQVVLTQKTLTSLGEKIKLELGQALEPVKALISQIKEFLQTELNRLNRVLYKGKDTKNKISKYSALIGEIKPIMSPKEIQTLIRKWDSVAVLSRYFCIDSARFFCRGKESSPLSHKKWESFRDKLVKEYDPSVNIQSLFNIKRIPEPAALDTRSFRVLRS